MKNDLLRQPPCHDATSLNHGQAEHKIPELGGTGCLVQVCMHHWRPTSQTAAALSLLVLSVHSAAAPQLQLRQWCCGHSTDVQKPIGKHKTTLQVYSIAKHATFSKLLAQIAAVQPVC